MSSLARVTQGSWDVAPDRGSPELLLTNVQSVCKRKEWNMQGDTLRLHEAWQVQKCSAHGYLTIRFLFLFF